MFRVTITLRGASGKVHSFKHSFLTAEKVFSYLNSAIIEEDVISFHIVKL